MLNRWEKAIYAYKNFLPRTIFDPYTQPIINGAMSDKTCGEGPQMSVLLSGDPDLIRIRDVIITACEHGFDVCRTYIEKFDYIRGFCVTNQGTNVKKIRHEKGNQNRLTILLIFYSRSNCSHLFSDVRVFAKYLETYHKQMQNIEQYGPMQFLRCNE